ncbi:hypothetical protein L615_005800000190 [Nocardioides sp. J9]|uniref:hypothetical protein n=1 Tax=unclassified Nocardioides TaxID=2615069 RepID=UPI00048C3D26|nr:MULTISPECIES: hypothetical protein [unclassified Nocardioides]TWG94149.1 hypothetical protein L615_005800000190 [Nocardioides sp. J9]
MRLRAVGAVLCGVALLGTVTACGDDEKSGSDEVVTIDITIEGGKVDPSGERVEVGAGQPVDLVVTADEPGELHLHSDPEQQLEYDAGTTTLGIAIDRPGVVAVESHELGQIIVQLEVR